MILSISSLAAVLLVAFLLGWFARSRFRTSFRSMLVGVKLYSSAEGPCAADMVNWLISAGCVLSDQASAELMVTSSPWGTVWLSDRNGSRIIVWDTGFAEASFSEHRRVISSLRTLAQVGLRKTAA